MKNSQRFLVAFAFATFVSLSPSTNGADLDGDGIDDAIENQLLQRFAPVLYPNEQHDVPEEGAGVPVSVTWLLRNSRIMRVVPEQVLLDRPDISAAVQFVADSGNGALGRRIRNYHVWGDSPGDVRSWPISIGLGEGVYGRVWKPWPNTHTNLYSVQYFVLLTWNETAYSLGFGNHESDWLCVDYTIDARLGFENPPIIHAIYHNHGPQIFVTPELLESENGHPVVYVEKGTNEAWPNRGTRGKDGWPRSNGFATNMDWDDNEYALIYLSSLLCGPYAPVCALLEIPIVHGFTPSEYKIHREHDGNGNRYATHDVPNIGGVSNDVPVSLCGEEGRFLLQYQGLYGWESSAPGDPPESPCWQAKMWNREWTDGPWSNSREPFSPDTSGFHLFATDGYTFSVPTLRDATYVDFRSQREGNGSSTLPYKNLLLGIAMTADNGTVVMQPGSFPSRFEINQPVTLTAPSGAVTIGQ